jgi:outer membrane protein OmpA-like peptidoglycan-associated protein
MLEAAQSQSRQHARTADAATSSVVQGRSTKLPGHSETRLARLQSAHGNQQVQRLLSNRVLQAKLTVNQPGDVYEQEADRVADAVMRMASGPCESPLQPDGRSDVLQRCSCGGLGGETGQCDECKGKSVLHRLESASSSSGTAPPIVTEVIGSPGRPLDASSRDFMEPLMGHDFSQVRVHTDPRAAESARAVNALAYTVGHHVVFGNGAYNPRTSAGQRLLAHELTHVVQQGQAATRRAEWTIHSSPETLPKDGEAGACQVSEVLQRAGDPAAIPVGFACPTDLTVGKPAGTDLLFPSDSAAITPAHTALLTTFRASWLASGGTDDIVVHGYASTDGPQAHNWTLSCDRAQAVQAELIRLGIPAVRINVLAHGESTDFGAGIAANRHAVVSSHAGFLPLPIVRGTLTARDNFAGRSDTRFGVGETIDLNFASIPPRPAADFGGLQWFLVAGGGTLAGATAAGTATYTAPPTAAPVQLELRVAGGATAGRVVSTHNITVVIPTALRQVAVVGSFPNFGGWGSPTIPAGTWGVGFIADEFIDPKDVSFQGVAFSEGTVAAVVTGSFLAARAGIIHPANPHGVALGGNATTGCKLTFRDGVSHSGGVTPRILMGRQFCGASDFLWAIPLFFSVAGGPNTRYAGGFTANQHLTSNLACNATVEKAGAGPFCRTIGGTVC